MEKVGIGGKKIIVASKHVISRPSAKITCEPPSPVKEEGIHSGIYCSIWPLILFGRLTLLIPCGMSSYLNYKKFKMRLQLIPLVVGSSVACLSFANMLIDFRDLSTSMMSVKTSNNSNKTGGSTEAIMIYVNRIYEVFSSLASLAVMIIFLRHSDTLFKLLKTWSLVQRKFNLEGDKTLIYVSYASVVFMIIRIAFYIAYIIDTFYYRFDGSQLGLHARIENMTFLQAYYNMAMRLHQDIIPNNEFFIVIQLLLDIIKTIPTMFVAQLILFFSRATAFLIQRLVEDATKSRISVAYTAKLESKDGMFWEEFVAKFQAIRFLIKATNNVLSPFVFVFAVASVTQISLLLLEVLTKRLGINSQFMFVIWFTIEIVQFLLTFMNATKIPTNVNRILDVLEKCPEVHYSTQVARLENLLSSGYTIAFSGLGYFRVNKAFLLHIVGVIFSIQIFLLQSMMPTNV